MEKSCCNKKRIRKQLLERKSESVFEMGDMAVKVDSWQEILAVVSIQAFFFITISAKAPNCIPSSYITQEL